MLRVCYELLKPRPGSRLSFSRTTKNRRQNVKPTNYTRWQFLPKTGSVFLMTAVILCAISWLKPEHRAQTHQTYNNTQAEFREQYLASADDVTVEGHERPEKPARGRGNHPGPPPPPPGVPPTVLFLIGGALGYLIGRRGPHCPPPPPPPFRQERTSAGST